MNLADSAGALAIHGLLVGNQMPALKLGLRVIRAAPECLLAVHKPPVFTDENSFHIVAVNRHEQVSHMPPLCLRPLGWQSKVSVAIHQNGGMASILLLVVVWDDNRSS